MELAMKTHLFTVISFISMVMLTPAYGSESPEMLEVKQPVVEKQLEVVISRSEERPEQSMSVVVRGVEDDEANTWVTGDSRGLRYFSEC